MKRRLFNLLAVGSLLLAVIVAVQWVPAAIMFRAHRRARRGRLRAAAGLCPSCGYDLRATLGNCPECGAAAVDDAAPPASAIPARPPFDFLPRRARTALRTATRASTVAAAALFLFPFLLTVVPGALQFRHSSGNANYLWGVSGQSFYVLRHEPFPAPAPAPGEVPVASSGRVVKEGSFAFAGSNGDYPGIRGRCTPG